MGYVVAKYIRLSMDDALSDSDSIENQHALLDKFISELPDDDIKVLEFVDNGYTGTNLERPQFQKLLALVHTGEVNCIVVKDFSRLGRNVVDSGYFVEKVFPLYKVRFVALGDKYDSSKTQNNAAAMGMVFKFLVNELYSKEISKKIRMALTVRTQQGLFVRTNCIYGYKLDSQRRMVIDSKAADTVRLIYASMLQGMNVSEIVRRLYMENRKSPSAYKKGKNTKASDGQFDSVWSSGTVRSILCNEQYTGTYVGGKTARVEIGRSKAIRKDESEWVKIPGHHPAIIEKADFEAVQRLMRERYTRGPNRSKTASRASVETDRPISLLTGKAACGHCGHTLRTDSRLNPSLCCNFTRHAPSAPCHGFSIPEKELAGKVTEAVVMRLQDMDLSHSHPSGIGDSHTVSPESQDVRQLYEQYLTGEIDRETYLSRQEQRAEKKYKNKILAKAAQDTLSHIAAPIHTALEDVSDIARTVLDTGVLTTEIVDALIKKVFVHLDGSVKICWKPDAAGNNIPVGRGMEYAG